MKNKRSVSGVRRKAPLRVQKACVNCRKRKQACDDSRPCRRCTQKGIDCREVSHDHDQPELKRSRTPHDIFFHDDEECDHFYLEDTRRDKLRLDAGDDSDNEESMYEGSDSDESPDASESGDEADSDLPHLASSQSSSVPSSVTSSPIQQQPQDGHSPEQQASMRSPQRASSYGQREATSPSLKRDRRQLVRSTDDALSSSVASLTFDFRPNKAQDAQQLLLQQQHQHQQLLAQHQQQLMHFQAAHQQLQLQQQQQQQPHLQPAAAYAMPVAEPVKVQASASVPYAHSQPVPVGQPLQHRRVAGLSVNVASVVVQPPSLAPVPVPPQISKSCPEFYPSAAPDRVQPPGLSLDFLLPFWRDLAAITRTSAASPTASTSWNGPAPAAPAPAAGPVEETPFALYTNEHIYGLDFPFHTCERRRSIGSEESAPDFMGCTIVQSRMNAVLHRSWRQFLQRAATRKVKDELAQAKQAWQHVMDLLRAMDYTRVQQYLQAMEAASSSKEIFGETVTPGILCWSSCGRIHHANQAFSSLVGYSLDEIRASGDIGAHLLFHPEDLSELLRRQLEALQYPESSSYCLDARLRGRFGRETRVSVCVANLRDPLGMPLLTVGHFTIKA